MEKAYQLLDKADPEQAEVIWWRLSLSLSISLPLPSLFFLSIIIVLLKYYIYS